MVRGGGDGLSAVTGHVDTLAWQKCVSCGRLFLRRQDSQRCCSPRCSDRDYNARRPVQRVPRQADLFGAELKAEGKALAADRNPEMLETFRRIARELGRDGDEVDIDDVRERAEQEGIQYTSGNWMGSVFNEPCWQFIRFRRATHASAHARPVGVWRLA